MRTIDALVQAVRQEAERAEFPIDRPIYERADKDPLEPVLFAGRLEAPVCVFGRDLGKDEVAHGQPLIGAGGKLVRRGLLGVFGDGGDRPDDRWLEAALQFALLTNTVPYKPPGNKAYSDAVKERFRPYIEELLTCHWQGNRILTLGTEAFGWFAPYIEPGAAEAFWARDDRYEAELPAVLVSGTGSQAVRKPVTIGPLPHPSPLNTRWYRQFPELLARRLQAVRR